MRRHARVLFAVAALASFFAFASSALADYNFRGVFSGPGNEDGQLGEPGRAAAEQSTGNLFVVDSTNDRVQVFAPNAFGSAEYMTKFGGGDLSSPWGIAIDEQAGQTHVYVADADNDRILKYDSDEAAIPSFTIDGSFSVPAGAGAGQVGDFKAALAIDPSTHDLLVADRGDNRVERFEADGTPVSAFDGSAGPGSPGAFTGLLDLAVNSTGDVYVVDETVNISRNQGTSQVLRYSANGDYKTTLMPVGVRQTPALVAVNPFDDSVVVSAGQNSFYTGEKPEIYGFDAGDEPTKPVAVDGSAQQAQATGLAVSAHESPARLYAVYGPTYYYSGEELVGIYGTPVAQAFEQLPPLPPTVVGQSASATETEARLSASINPGNLPTTYHFEWGVTSAYGNSTPIGRIQSGESPVTVRASLFNLAAGTYHYRVVATNALETVAGPDRTFRTVALLGGLPDGRGYEQVSPPDKQGNDALFSAAMRSSASGDAFFFESNGAFGGSEGAGKKNDYLASRTSSGWLTASLTPKIEADPEAPITASYNSIDFSPDLSKYLYQNRAIAPGGFPVRAFFLREADGSHRQVSPMPATDPTLLYAPVYVGGSDDLSHVVFESSVALTPDTPVGTQRNLYEWHDGAVSLVGILPDGTPAPEGAFGVFAADGTPMHEGPIGRSSVSPDGSQIVFGSGSPAQLYLRANDSTTAISLSQKTGSVGDPAPSGVQFLAAVAADGRKISKVFFMSADALTDDSNPGNGEDAGAIYAYDVTSGNLEDITATANPGGSRVGQAPWSIWISPSRDGSYVYFNAAGEFTPEVEPNAGVALWVWHNGTIRYVGPINTSFGFAYLERTRISDSGERLLISSQVPFSSDQTNGYEQVFLYDAPSHDWSCLSCPASGSPTADAVLRPILAGTPGAALSLPSNLTADGKRAYFETEMALAPKDTNGKVDVYEWHEGEVNLISTGRGADGAHFMDATADGRDVFFGTRERILPSDRDNNEDVYDARIGGGGLGGAPPSFVACEGDACQPSVSAPNDPSPASAGFKGEPNPKAKFKRPARRGHKAKRKNRHVKSKKHQKKQQQRASGNATRGHRG